jgi:hypothetical protein
MLATGAYYLAACWLTLRAAQGPSPQRSAFLTGAFFAAAVHTHLFIAVFVPLPALLYWAALPRNLERPFVRSLKHAALMAAGALTLTALLMAIHRGTGGDWLFFMHQIGLVQRLASGNAWWMGNPADWLPGATYLVIPVVFSVAGLTLLARRGNLAARRLMLSFVAQSWAVFAVLCLFQFVTRQFALQWDYFAFVANFHAFPCVAAALAYWGGRDEPQDRPLTAVVCSIVMLGTLLVLLPTRVARVLGDASSALGLVHLPPVGPPLVTGLLGVAAMFMFKGSARLLTFALWFAIVNAWIAPFPSVYGMGTPGSRQQMAALFREADQFTTDIDPTLLGIKYWFRDGETAVFEGQVKLNDVFDSFVSTRGWTANLLAGKSPGLPIDQLTVEHLDAATCIGLLSSTASHEELREKLSARFERLGRPLIQVASRRFERPAISFALTVLKSSSEAETLPPCYPT